MWMRKAKELCTESAVIEDIPVKAMRNKLWEDQE
jgi:hypothetical protein